MPQRRIATALVLALLLTACHGYTVHPGALNSFDSHTYDSLIVTKAVIDASRDQFASGALSPKLKPAVNTLVEAYNKANDAYQAWHKATEAGGASDSQLSTLKTQLLAMTAAFNAFKTGKP